MYQESFKVKLNSYFKHCPKKEIPKFVLIFFLAFVIGFGLDFGFVTALKKKYRIVIRCVGVIIPTILIFLTLQVNNYDWHHVALMYSFLVLQYFVPVLLVYTAKYNLYNFIIDIYKIHNKIYNKEYRFILCVIAYYSIVWVVRIWFLFWYVYLKIGYTFNITHINLMYFLVANYFVLDLVAIAQIFIYYYVYAALKFLRKLMENENLDFKNVLRQFMMIADCCDKISALYGKLVSI